MHNELSQIGVFALGIQTTICPCLLTVNITAIAYLVGRSQNAWLAGLLYALGQILAFWGLSVLILGVPLFSGEYVTRFLASTLRAWLGPVLILIGIVLLGLLRFSLPSWHERTLEIITRWFGKWSALPLGMMFAMAFCPKTAATFLGMLGLTAERMSATESMVPLMVLPAFFGLGTSLPILFFSGIMATQRRLLRLMFEKTTGLERPARWFTGAVFILAGLWLTYKQFL